VQSVPIDIQEFASALATATLYHGSANDTSFWYHYH
jgi:hypothetical protein